LLETLRETSIWPQLAVELGLEVDLQATVSNEPFEGISYCLSNI